jgi:DNA polymerase/3'-5' exonuclease PolX
MKYSQLIWEIRKLALNVLESKETNSKFRAMNYYQAADIISKNEASNKQVTEVGINSLPLTTHMKNKILLLANLAGSNLANLTNLTNNNLTNSNLTNLTNLKNELVKIKGISNEKADKLISMGLNSIKDLKSKKFDSFLNKESKLFIELKPLQKIPYDHINKLEQYLHSYKLKFNIVGSYRRKKSFSSDIDILILSNKDNGLILFYDKLKKIFEDNIHIYAKGMEKMSFILNFKKVLNTESNILYKVDVFKANSSTYIPILLYSTGSKEFNIKMRALAKSKGYLLNQKGIFKNNILVNKTFKNEKDYFDFLNIEYLNPEDR